MVVAREWAAICDHAALFGDLMTQMAEFAVVSELTQRGPRVKYQQTFDTAATSIQLQVRYR
jgi:hypothetical protein